ncbi:MAG: DUF4373 domain-containing protein [Candidatus Odinarchaeota archaeon]
MARPKKNNLDYFSHDNCMRNDRKIKALRAKFGLKGYAIYNMLLEILCESELLIIKLDKTELELISGDLTIVSEELTTIIEYLCKINLFKKINDYIFCPQLDKRSEGVFGKRTKLLNHLREESGIILSETDISEEKIPQSKVNKSKIKENTKRKKFKPPTLEQVKQYFKENGYTEQSAIKAFKHYDIANWHDSEDKPVKNWKQKMFSNWFTKENKIKQGRDLTNYEHKNGGIE